MAYSLFTRLSASYFFYFCVLGLVVPFLTLYLDHQGFNSVEIGEITGLFLATKIIGPSLCAIVSDRSGQQIHMLRLGGLLSLVFFSLLFLAQSYWSTVLVLACFGFFWTAMLPQLEVLTLNSVKQQPKIYARIRLWGSIGFIVIAIAGGELIERYSADSFVYLGFVVLLGLFLSTLVNRQPRARAAHGMSLTPIASKLLCSGFLLFFIAGILLQVSFGPYYTFFALYLQQVGYSGLVIGLLISLGVIAEIVIFIYIGLVFKRYAINTILLFSLAVTALRWLLIGSFPETLLLLLVAQLIHAASFGLYHSASMSFIQQHFEPSQQGRGQAIYVSGVYGVGGALGAYLSGIIWQGGAGAQLTFYSASLVAIIATLLVMNLPKKRKNKRIQKLVA